ncbi:flavin reductase family protein [Pusillimonas sp.]|uniref:flavin reductase family protein n=1 Tax=Pusillimonas sp. TaxID=3040095 RepID=UPI0037C76610
MPITQDEWVTVDAPAQEFGPANMAAPQQRHLRNALGCFPTGVAVITTRDEAGALYGVTVSSFNAVSLDPPMVLWSQKLSAPSHGVFRRAVHFGVNVLGNHQRHLSERFSRPSTNKFDSVDYMLTPEGVPLLEDVAAQFVCRNDFRSYGGDHAVFFGTVMHFGYSPTSTPLIFSRGGYLD